MASFVRYVVYGVLLIGLGYFSYVHVFVRVWDSILALWNGRSESMRLYYSERLWGYFGAMEPRVYTPPQVYVYALLNLIIGFAGPLMFVGVFIDSPFVIYLGSAFLLCLLLAELVVLYRYREGSG